MMKVRWVTTMWWVTTVWWVFMTAVLSHDGLVTSQGLTGTRKIYVRVPKIMTTGTVIRTSFVISDGQCGIDCYKTLCEAFSLRTTDAGRECIMYINIASVDTVALDYEYEISTNENNVENLLSQIAAPAEASGIVVAEASGVAVGVLKGK
ncbi:uncharacterized protein LOC121870185 isoform X1 [Homarus americanus]|nr:uncharacterized protein LOC121870185 isoform X1 [Homarus americanus]